MEETIEYYPTGKFARLGSDQFYIMTDKWYVRYDYQEDNLLIAATKLENKEGEITVSKDDWFSVPGVEHWYFPMLTVDGDTLLVSVTPSGAGTGKILMIDLCTRQCDEYPYLDKDACAIGIDDDVVYLACRFASGAKFVGLNWKTRDVIFEYHAGGLLIYAMMGKIYDGRRVIGQVNQRPDGDVYEIVSVPNGEVHLRVEGESWEISQAGQTMHTQYGVFYVSEDGNRYYSTFAGETYRVSIEINPPAGFHTKDVYFSPSGDAQSIWLEFKGENSGNYIANYRMRQQRRQKSARSRA